MERQLRAGGHNGGCVCESDYEMCEVLSLQSCGWEEVMGGGGGCIKCMPEVALAT